MSSLPLISHHLFVAAIGNPDELRPESSRQLTDRQQPVLPLEVLDWAEPLPEKTARPSWTSQIPNKS